MTDRYFSLVVILEKDIREDDAQAIIDAIKMIKGVLAVEPQISNPEFRAAELRAKSEIAKKLWSILSDDT